MSSFLRVGIAAVAGGAVTWAVLWATPALSASKFGFLGQLALGGLAGLAVTYGLIALMRVEEIGDALALAKRRLWASGRGRAQA